MLKTIIFDLSDVLIQGATGMSKLINKKLRSNLTDSDLLTENLGNLFVGKISETEYWQSVIDKTSLEISIDELKGIVRKNFKEIKGTRQIIEKLQQHYKLGLLSNHTKEWVEYCEGHFHYEKLFNSVAYSYNSHATKPSDKIFKFLLEKLEAKPEETLFIDDYEKNVLAAKKLGLQAIKFTSPHQLIAQLRELGISI